MDSHTARVVIALLFLLVLNTGADEAPVCTVSIVNRTVIGLEDPVAPSSPANGLRLQVPVNIVSVGETDYRPCDDQDSCSRQVRNEQNFYINALGRADVGYNFYIGEDGEIYEGRGWNKIGVHSPGINHQSIGVAFLGSFTGMEPNTAAQDALNALIECGIADGHISSSYEIRAQHLISGSLLAYVNSLGPL